MADFKSSFMGGYKKKQVNEYIEKLEKENEDLKNTAKASEQKIAKALRLQDEYKKLKSKISEFEQQKINDENEKALLANEVNTLKRQVEVLNSKLAKSNKTNDRHIENIGNIFYKAYESGSEIVDEAKSKTDDFLADISKSSIDAKAEIENAVTEYAMINTDIKALINSIIKSVNAVADNTDKLIEKAGGIANSMGKIDNIRLENEKNANNVIEKYGAFFKEYESEKTAEAENEKSEADFEEVTAADEVKEVTTEPEEEIKEETKEVTPPAVLPIIESEVKVDEKSLPKREEISKKEVKVTRPQLQRQNVQRKQITPSFNQQTAKVQKDEAPNTMNQNRAVMLREVLKKFQNNNEQE